MSRHVGSLGSIATLATLAAIGWNAPALAQQQTTITKMSGTATATGVWTRTIIDISEPNGPGGGTIQAIYPVNTPYTIGDNGAQVASAYRTACLATLPAPPNNPNGYGAKSENSVVPAVRLSKQAGTYNYSDGAFPPGINVATIVPSNAADAPAVTPAGLAALAASLSAVAWWARRRKTSA